MDGAAPIVGLVRRAEAQLGPTVDRIVATLRERVTGYGAQDGLSDQDIRSVLTSYLVEILEDLKGAPRQSAPAYEVLMRRRAEEGIALTDMLHSYRIGVSLLWEELANLARGRPEATAALVDATPALFEVLDRYSLRSNEIHHEIALRDARRDEQVRASLLDAVLSIEASPSVTFRDAVALLAIPRSGHFVVLEAAHPHLGPNSATPADLETPISEHAGIDHAWFRVGPRSQVGIIALAQSPHDRVFGGFLALLERTTSTVGLSSPFTDIANAARARAQAHIALSAARANHRLVRYDHDLLPVLLASTPDAASTLVAQTFSGLDDLPEVRRVGLLDTIRVWIDHQQSVAATAAALHCHRNTVNYRLRRFQELTGRQLSDNRWLAQVVLALEAESQRLHPSGLNRPGILGSSE